jgi:hypothetical protein
MTTPTTDGLTPEALASLRALVDAAVLDTARARDRLATARMDAASDPVPPRVARLLDDVTARGETLAADVAELAEALAGLPVR